MDFKLKSQDLEGSRLILTFLDQNLKEQVFVKQKYHKI